VRGLTFGQAPRARWWWNAMREVKFIGVLILGNWINLREFSEEIGVNGVK
jgi:hypothetical protein